MNLRSYSILYLCHIVHNGQSTWKKSRSGGDLISYFFSRSHWSGRTVLPGHWYFKQIEIRSIKRDILKYRNITFTYIQIYPFPRHWEIPILNIFKGWRSFKIHRNRVCTLFLLAKTLVEVFKYLHSKKSEPRNSKLRNLII